MLTSNLVSIVMYYVNNKFFNDDNDLRGRMIIEAVNKF